MERPPPERRRFLTLAAWAMSGGLAALASVPVLGALFSPLVRPTPGSKGKAGFINVAQLADLIVGLPLRVDIIGEHRDSWSIQDHVAVGSAWLLRRKDGTVEAFSTVCPHLGCPINFDAAAFKCPCHDSAFTLQGERTFGPAKRGLDTLEVQVKDGVVALRPARFEQGSDQKREL